MNRFLLILALLAPIAAPAGAQTSDRKPAAWARVVPERKDDLAWENDFGAYRLYGPPLANSAGQENSGIDVWFKRVPYPVMDRWYADDLAGRRSYHDPKGSDGYDGFKVGPTRGGGGTALWENGAMVLSGVYRTAKIVSGGPREAKFVVTYEYATPGGAVTETKTITSKVGEPLFESRSVFTRDGKPLTGQEVAIGLVTQTPQAAITLDPANGILAIWDQLDGAGFGLGAVIPKSSLVRMLRQPDGTAEHALAIVKTDAKGEIHFRAGGVWSKNEAARVHSAAQWLARLKAIRP